MRACVPPTPPTLQVLTETDTFSIDQGLSGNLDKKKNKIKKKKERQ
jgi:hypothetical protein